MQLSHLSESPPMNPDMVAKYRDVYKEDHQVNLIDDQSTGISVPNDSRNVLCGDICRRGESFGG